MSKLTGTKPESRTLLMRIYCRVAYSVWLMTACMMYALAAIAVTTLFGFGVVLVGIALLAALKGNFGALLLGVVGAVFCVIGGGMIRSLWSSVLRRTRVAAAGRSLSGRSNYSGHSSRSDNDVMTPLYAGSVFDSSGFGSCGGGGGGDCGF